VDVAAEAVFAPQDLQRLDHPLAGVIGVFEDARREEEPLDIVAAVELDRQFGQLARSERRAAHVVRAAVDAVFAVVDAGVGHQHL